jgi:putative membrane protein
MQSLALLVSSVVLTSLSLYAQGDSKFVKEASEGGLAEVQLGQLAQQKGQNQAVKDFGQRMVSDHTKANEELKAVAAGENMPVSTSLGVSNSALKLKLEALSGAAFDKAYMSAMVKDHQEDIAAFEKEASGGQDTKVKSFAAKTLPTLREHLSMAEKAAASVGAK